MGDLQARGTLKLSTPNYNTTSGLSNPKKSDFLIRGTESKLNCRKQEDELFLVPWALQ